MRRRVLALALSAAIALGVGAYVSGRATSSAPDPALATVSAGGDSLALGERALTVLDRMNATQGAGFARHAERLAVRGTRTFFRLRGTRESCYGTRTGQVDETLPDLGILLCSPRFPSAKQPIMSMSVVEATKANPVPRLIKVQGVVADAIAEVGVVDASGDVVLRLPVRDNVFSADELPAGEMTGLVGFDAAGARVYTESVR